jgi:hypothetical protein
MLDFSAGVPLFPDRLGSHIAADAAPRFYKARLQIILHLVKFNEFVVLTRVYAESGTRHHREVVRYLYSSHPITEEALDALRIRNVCVATG